ncbi:MAG: hypothetical protein E7383_07605 [Ruminococcaceae bacterium]|nr:hypothetical protein [Oscillospiraceae bacterium]
MTFDSLRDYFIVALYLAGSVTLALGVISLIRTILEMAAGQSTRKWVLRTVVLCSAGTLLLASGIWGRKIVEERRWNQALDENYTFYIDGVQVNPDTVVPSDYKITYDDENKNVMITRSNNIGRLLW